MGVQHVRKWCKVFRNGQTDIQDDNDGWPSTSEIHMTAASVEDQILEN
jgi:hypothetical protein